MSKFRVAGDDAANSLEKLADDLTAAPDLKSALDSTMVPALVHDGASIVHANKSCGRWLGYDKSEVLSGVDLRVMAAEEDHRSLLAALGAGQRGLPRGAHIQRFARRSGEPMVANVLVRSARLAGRSLVLAICEPSSSAHRSSDRLRVLEEAVDHLHDIVFITEARAIDDVGRRIVFVNRVFSLITGYDQNDVLGKTPNVTIGELTDRKVLARIERGLKNQEPVHEEILKYGKHGDKYWVELDILPVYDEQGEHTHWVSVQRDISERRTLQQKLVESERLASVGLLSAKLAGAVNAPLQAALSKLSKLSDRLPQLLEGTARSKDEVGEALALLHEAQSDARRVAETTRHLRLLSRAPQLKLEPVDVREVLDSTVALIQATNPIPGRVERSYEKAATVFADRARLVHVFHFALTNAAASLLEERAEQNIISVRLRGLSDGVLITIEDNGVGVSSEIAQHLFTPFADKTLRRGDQGLGLFIANCLVRELGGSIDVRACEHAGSKLEVFLPSAPQLYEQSAAPAH